MLWLNLCNWSSRRNDDFAVNSEKGNTRQHTVIFKQNTRSLWSVGRALRCVDNVQLCISHHRFTDMWPHFVFRLNTICWSMFPLLHSKPIMSTNCHVYLKHKILRFNFLKITTHERGAAVSFFMLNGRNFRLVIELSFSRKNKLTISVSLSFRDLKILEKQRRGKLFDVSCHQKCCSTK